MPEVIREVPCPTCGTEGAEVRQGKRFRSIWCKECGEIWGKTNKGQGMLQSYLDKMDGSPAAVTSESPTPAPGQSEPAPAQQPAPEPQPAGAMSDSGVVKFGRTEPAKIQKAAVESQTPEPEEAEPEAVPVVQQGKSPLLALGLVSLIGVAGVYTWIKSKGKTKSMSGPKPSSAATQPSQSSTASISPVETLQRDPLAAQTL